MANYTEAQLRAKLNIDPPNELRFIGPFTRPVITKLKLTNPSEETILFKIKTTAPKRYCVRPNYGFVRPHDFVLVEICLQPFQFDPVEKNKHKFMVQSIVSPSKEEQDIQDPNIWKELPAKHFMDAKLKCVFEMPEEAPESAVKNEDTLPPKAKNEEKILNLDTSDQSDWQTNEQLRQLREENSNLRKEVLKLKENLVKIQSAPSKSPMGEPYTPVVAENQIPMFYIAIAIAALIFGIIFGKCLL